MITFIAFRSLCSLWFNRSEIYDHGQMSWDIYTVRKLFNKHYINIRALLALHVPTLSPTPQTKLKPSRQNFFDLSKLYWVVKGRGYWTFKMTTLFFKTLLVTLQNCCYASYYPKDFCPGL